MSTVIINERAIHLFLTGRMSAKTTNLQRQFFQSGKVSFPYFGVQHTKYNCIEKSLTRISYTLKPGEKKKLIYMHNAYLAAYPHHK